MSLRSLSNISGLLAVHAFVFGVSVSGAALAAGTAANTPPVQTYAEQAVPTEAPSSQAMYDSPLAAGTLTLEDVLDAHKPAPGQAPKLPAIGGTPSTATTAPVLTSPVRSSATGLMMSQGMKAVLQKVGTTNTVPLSSAASSGVSAPLLPVSSSLSQIPASADGKPASLVPEAVSGASGVTYEAGQAPKSLGGGTVSAPASSAHSSSVAPEAAVSAAPGQACSTNVQKWEKSCGEAGYPSTYLGKISGETRTDCKDGALHDVWVTNTCAPLDAATAQTVKTDGVCGSASNNDFDDAPSANLCAQGVPGTVTGEGPWMWACSGINGGEASACAAQKHVVPSNGVCGSANGVVVGAAPSSDLCDSGTASAIQGEGPWKWSCKGVGKGSSVSCIAPVALASAPVSAPAPAASPVLAPAPVHTLTPASTPKPAHVLVPPSASAADEVPVVDAETPAPAPEPTPAPVVSHHAPAHVLPPAPVAASVEEPVAAPVVAHPAVQAPAPAPLPVPTPTPSPASASAATASDSGELCGAASETLAYEMPEKDLCRAGTASVVNGDGPWTWSCTNNEGTASSCRTLSLKGDAAEASPAAETPAAAAEPAVPEAAPQAAVSTSSETSPRLHARTSPFVAPAPVAPVKPAKVELACGPASGQPAKVAPDSDLCQGGKASAVRGSNPWLWTCGKGKGKISCATTKSVDGACGSANGMSLQAAPFSGLCSAGMPSGVAGEGPWNWTCGGSNGGSDISCAASLQSKADKVDGACGSADGSNVKEMPADGLCSSGTPGVVNGSGPWTWSCSGTNGGAVGSCSASKIVPPKAPGVLMNGLCGSANGATTTVQPSEGLCSSGTLSGIVGNGPWNWSCVGENGGMTVSCTAPLEPPAPIDGACGGANGVPTLAKPQSGLCSAGITGSVNGKGPWTWACSGANGGNPASCVAPVAGKSGAMPSNMTPAVDSGEAQPEVTTPAYASASASGLVTPQLASQGAVPPLNKHVLPSLTKSKPFAAAPTPSHVPDAVDVTSDVAPAAVPDVSGVEPLQPPSLRDTLPTAPVLQESTAPHAAHIPGNHLVLDPTVSTILFSKGSGNIDENVLVTLNKLAIVLEDNPDVRVSLLAYADNNGTTTREARRLSLARALAVRGYLSSRGVSDSRVDVHAEGANTSMGYIDRVDVKVNN